MDCTVIVITIGGPWLADQLRAVVGQEPPPGQVVLVNNGRAGAVDDVVARLRAELPQLELVEDDRIASPGHARNVGAARATCPGLLFLDDDDVIEPGYVDAMSRALDHAGLVGARMGVAKLNSPRLTRRWGTMQDDGPMTYFGFLPWVLAGALGVRQDVFDKIDGFSTDTAFGEDEDFSWRAQLDAGASIGHAPEAFANCRLRSTVTGAFHQGRNWAIGEVGTYQRFRERGMPGPSNQLRALARWLRPVLLLAQARHYDDLVVAARELGGRVGRAQGSIMHRCLYL